MFDQKRNIEKEKGKLKQGNKMQIHSKKLGAFLPAFQFVMKLNQTEKWTKSGNWNVSVSVCVCCTYIFHVSECKSVNVG